MQGKPENMQANPTYVDIVDEINIFFNSHLDTISEAGIEQVILDPGFGFGKTIEHNYILLNKLKDLKKAGKPILIGISRKSMIYKYLNITPDDALPATTALHLNAIIHGADILRVHDVKEAVEVIKLSDMLSKEPE
jgi:dihydropteroate synthase